MSKTKCYSVRLESLTSISEKCYKATAYDGSTTLIPKSQVFGQDYDVQKSDAWWISAWILEQKNLQYSSKKVSFFDKDRAEFVPETGVEIERHIPEEKECIETEPLTELVKEVEKTNEQIIKEIKKNDLLKGEEITEAHPLFLQAIEFYKKYPQYKALEANAIFWILGSIRTKKKPVNVHKFNNGSIWFVGDVITATNAPIASIGEWKSPTYDSWENDLKNCSEIIEKIEWSF